MVHERIFQKNEIRIFSRERRGMSDPEHFEIANTPTHKRTAPREGKGGVNGG